MSALCPHCGYDLQRDAPIALGDACFSWGEGLAWRGAAVALSPQQRVVVQALLKARGGRVTRDAPIARLGSEAEAQDMLLRTHICAIRAALRGVGGPDPIRVERGVGYRWVG